MANDCAFCKIVTGNIPTEKKTHHDGSIISFLDIEPKAPGHTLVVPAKHYRWFIDMPENEYLLLMAVVHQTAKTLKEEYGADYIQVGIVGDEIPHVHVHLIPRAKGPFPSP